MNELSIVDEQLIMEKIYVIRDQKVMLDSDLAQLYQVETKVLKQAVKRNIARFPKDFMFELDADEFKVLRSQFVTSKTNTRGGSRYMPYCFTEQGVAMLSSILNSERAIAINIQIIRTFIRLRKALTEQVELPSQILALWQRVDGHDKSIDVIFTYLQELGNQLNKPDEKKIRKRLGYKPDE